LSKIYNSVTLSSLILEFKPNPLDNSVYGMNSNTVMSLVKERLKESSETFKNDHQSIKIVNDENSFMNSKIFPLKRRKVTSKVPEYCDLLNFDGEKYNLPNSFNPEDRSNRIEVESDGKMIKYVGPGRNDSDAAAIRSNIPVPPQVGIYYFEVKVVNRGRDGFIAVGYAIKSASLGRLTGWEPGTIGYHADDGNLYRGAGTGTSFGPSYTTNDIVGCGINFVEKSFFFTKNGVLIGEIGNLKDKFHLPFFPSVGCRTVGEVLSINFEGQFQFNIESFIKKKLRNHFDYPQGFKEYDLIISYLIHCGYKGTAKAFMKETKLIFNSEIGGDLETSFKTAQNRRSVIEALRQGNMSELGNILRANFPSFLMENISVSFKLECLNFIELIRSNELEPNDQKLKDIIENGRRLTGQFPPDVIESNSNLLQDTLALLAYPQPSQSPVGYLLQKSFKTELADELDLALLKHEGKSPVSPMHQLLKQTQAVMDELQFIEDSEISLINL
jgi:Ran-binding protein 9/10